MINDYEDRIETSDQMDVKRRAAGARLEEYTEAQRQIAVYREKYSFVVVTLEALSSVVAEQEKALKEAVRELGEPLDNDEWVVTLQHKTAKTIDGDWLVSEAPWLRDVPGAVTMTTTVHEGVLKALVKAGSLSQELVDQATETKPLTTAVTIKRRGG